MNAPTPPAESLLHMFRIDMLSPSKTNPRKNFDEKKLAELADSIDTQGVLQPLPVRKHSLIGVDTGRYEIISGERRYRAAKIAGLELLPCFVRNLTDLQMLHAQVIENLQRDDLHPLEEAEGYERLMKDYGRAADDLAAEIGKSRAYIYGRLKLCALGLNARKAFYDGKIDASTALLIARIPVDKLQEQALKTITKPDWKGDAMSYRTARDLLQREYMTDLDKAPFPTHDSKLLDKVGACIDCIKRTGNQPELFDDVSSKDVCTDTVCYAMKKTAHVLFLQKDAVAKGHVVITGEDADKIIKYPRYNDSLHDSSYTHLDDICPHDPDERTWEEVLGEKSFEPEKSTGKPPVQKTLIENTHHHTLVETIKVEDAIKRLREMGMEITVKAGKGTGIDKLAQEKLYAAKKAKLEQHNAYRAHLYNKLHGIVGGLTPEVLFSEYAGLTAILARYHFETWADNTSEDEIHLLAELYTPGYENGETETTPEQSLRDAIQTMTAHQHFMLLVDMLMMDERTAWRDDSKPETLLNIAQVFNVDAAALEKEAITQFKARKKAEAAAAKKAEKTASIPAEAAQAPAKKPRAEKKTTKTTGAKS